MAVSMNTRPSIRVVRILPSASGWREILSVALAGCSHAYGNACCKGFESQRAAGGLGGLGGGRFLGHSGHGEDGGKHHYDCQRQQDAAELPLVAK